MASGTRTATRALARTDRPIAVTSARESGSVETALNVVRRQRENVRAMISDLTIIGDRQFGSRASEGESTGDPPIGPDGLIGQLFTEQEGLDTELKQLQSLIDRLKGL